MKMRRMLATVLAIVMVMSLLPAVSFAGAATPASDPVVLKKEFIETADGMPNELRLEAYVTGSLEKSNGSVPADIILVLDQSGSMDDNITSDGVTKSKLAIMKEAVTAFTDKVAELNTGGNGSDYRVAIVGFGSEDTNTEVLTTDPIRTYSYFQNNANFEYTPAAMPLNENNTYYIASGSGYEEIEYYEYLISTDGWYTDGGIWGGGSRVDVAQTTVYDRIAHPSLEYANAFINCTSAAVAGGGAIAEAIAALDGNGATRTDLGMEMADGIFLTQPAGTYTDRKKIVVVLTDGVPTTSNTFSATVANNAIEYAKEMKDNGTEIFALYFGNPSDDSKNFMQGMSSNYPDATAYTNLGTQEKTTYYSAHNNAAAITSVFNDIIYSIAANAQLDEEAVLQDELTKYFKLPDLLPGDIKDEIRVYTADKTATGWGPKILFEDATIDISPANKTISVKGFDYAYYCVTEESKSETVEDYGKKLVVYIPIIADETADTIGGYLPTNVHAGVYEGQTAVEADSPEITAGGHNDDVDMSYMMQNDEFFVHIGSSTSYDFEFSNTNMDKILDEMLVTKPDGSNNTGVRLEYRIYEADGGSYDNAIASYSVAKGSDAADLVTNIDNWTFASSADKTATINIAADNSASKVYVVECRAYNVNPAYDSAPVYNRTYGLLNITVVNDTVHIVGGVIDDGGIVEVNPLPANGHYTTDENGENVGYTEEVADGSLSSAMTFKLKEGYEFRRILLKTSATGALDTTTELYNIDGNTGGVTFEANGDYVYPPITVTGGQIVEVYTQPKTYTLTTKSDANSLIVDGRTYEYSETEKLAVPFSAKEGYEITSVKYGKTDSSAVEIIGMSPAELAALGIELKKVSEVDGYDAVGNSEKDLIQGEVLVPRTDDNYVEVTATARNYKLTYKQYKRVVDHLETSYKHLGDDPLYDNTIYDDKEWYVQYNGNLPSAPVEPGNETDELGNNDNYTVSDWYRYHPNNEFTGLTDVATTLMPAADMTLHAYWVQNPSKEVSIRVRKTAIGISGTADFEIMGTYHEHPVGDVTLSVSNTTPSVEGTLKMLLTDKQYDSFVAGDVIRITESIPAGDDWIFDTTEYTVHYNASGDPIIKKNDVPVNVAEFTNYYNAYTVNYNLDGGTYNGANNIPQKTVKYNDARLFPNDAPEKANCTFTGWKYLGNDVTNDTTYASLAGSPDVIAITLVAQYETKTYTVKYDLKGGNIGGAENLPERTVNYFDQNLLPTGTAVKDGYTFVGWVYGDETVTNDNTYASIAKSHNVNSITLVAVWEVDVIGEPDPDDGDGIPDKYQKKLIFKILNGTWDGADASDKVKVVTLLDGAGNPSASGEADISAIIPTGMIENSGYDTPGEWRDTPPTKVTGTNTETYLYLFHKTPDVIYDEYEEDKPEPTPTTEEYNMYEKIQVNPNGGVWNYKGQNHTDTQTIELKENIDLGTPTRDGYVFIGWLKTNGTGDIVHIYTAQWEMDEIGTTDPDDGDGTPDIFQKKLIFKVVNGTWADDTSTDIVAVVDLLDGNGKHSKTGEADISAIIPTGMKPNSGYRNGRWDVTPVSPATGSDTVTYTHSFEKIPTGGGGGGGVTRHTLTYETNGGSSIAKETYTSGTTVKLTKIPTKDGFIFEGWYEDKELTKPAEQVKMTKNITVYAKWVEDNGAAGSGYHTPDSLNGEDHFAYVIGYPDGTVRPNDHITRAEVTAIFFRLLKPDELREKNLTSENPFADVNADNWHNTAVSTMAKLGIVKGRTGEKFAPDADITRAEFAAICARFDDSKFEVVDDFTDVKGHWAEADIHEAAAHGWIKGYEDHTFKPDQLITRAEAMTMINRVLNRVPEKEDDLLADMIKWPDNSDKNAWYYLPVQEATNSHNYEMKNHIYEKWTALKQGTDWVKYQ